MRRLLLLCCLCGLVGCTMPDLPTFTPRPSPSPEIIPTVAIPTIEVTPVVFPTLDDPTPTPEVLTQRIGVQANPDAMDRGAFLAWLDRARPNSVVIFHDLDFAWQVYQHAGGTVNVTWRQWPYDGNIWQSIDPAVQCQQWHDLNRPGLRFMAPNEPNVRDPNFLDWTVRLMNACAALNVPVDVFNASVGTYQPEDVNSGLFDAMLRGLATHHDLMRMDVHEYNAGLLLANTSGALPSDALLDRNRVQPASWPQSIQFSRYADGSLPANWFVFRFSWFNIRAQQIGVQLPRIFMAEYGIDRVPTYESPVNYLDALQAQSGGIAPFAVAQAQQAPPAWLQQYWDSVRLRLYGSTFSTQSVTTKLFGAQTYRNAWRWYYPAWTWETAYAAQLRAAEGFLPDNVEAVCLFFWEEGGPWQQAGFDVSAPSLWDAILARP